MKDLHLQNLLIQRLFHGHEEPRTVLYHPNCEVCLVQSENRIILWWNQLPEAYTPVFVDDGLYESVVSSLPLQVVVQVIPPLRLPLIPSKIQAHFTKFKYCVSPGIL